MSTAFMFSGQGSQYAGMGKELYDSYDICREVFDKAAEAIDFPLFSVCFENDDRLNETKYAQPCILTHSMACFSLMKANGITADYHLGLSLGEYSALTASGAFDFEDAVRLVRKRGEFMTEATAPGMGGMSAILGLSEELTEKACTEASGERDYAACANYNMPGQLVISGSFEALEKAEKLCMEYGAKRIVRLNVSGPFHSAYLQPAAAKLEQELSKIAISDLTVPVISNTNAMRIESHYNIIPTLLRQLVSPVRWEQSVRRLITEGVDTFVELGSGKALCGFVRKIDKNVSAYNVEDIKSLEATLNALGIR